MRTRINHLVKELIRYQAFIVKESDLDIASSIARMVFMRLKIEAPDQREFWDKNREAFRYGIRKRRNYLQTSIQKKMTGKSFPPSFSM